MKAFENWYSNHETKTIASDKYHAGVAWKAALKWALKQAYEPYASDIEIAIERELEETE